MPPSPQPRQPIELAQAFKFDPDWIFDPIPWWLLTRLDDKVINELARVHFDAMRKALNLKLEVIEQVEGIVLRGK
jgi:hypothetical protein